MAPEILLHKRYGRAVDWWSFGVFIYVMLFGRYPFSGDDEHEILEAIMSDAAQYPQNMPPEISSIMKSLMHKNPARRLGGGVEDAAEVKQHPYFANIDWDALYHKQINPPFMPNIVCLYTNYYRNRLLMCPILILNLHRKSQI